MTTKRFFIRTAAILGSVEDTATREKLTDKFVAMFEHENPQFDAPRFRRAVKVESEITQ